MDLRTCFTTFVVIFLAELGDKTQLATLSFAAESKSPISVFMGAAGALILTSVLAVLFGSIISRWIPLNLIKLGAGFVFITLGVWMLIFSGTR